MSSLLAAVSTPVSAGHGKPERVGRTNLLSAPNRHLSSLPYSGGDGVGRAYALADSVPHLEDPAGPAGVINSLSTTHGDDIGHNLERLITALLVIMAKLRPPHYRASNPSTLMCRRPAKWSPGCRWPRLLSSRNVPMINVG